MVTLMEPTFEALIHICHHMRADDEREVFNAIGHRNRTMLARQTLDAGRMGSAVIAGIDGRPTAVMGTFPIRTGVCSAFCYSTDGFGSVALTLTRYALRVLRPALIESGYHRLQCESRVDHVEAHRWLERMGFQREGVLRKFGSDGSDYYQYAAIA